MIKFLNQIITIMIAVVQIIFKTSVNQKVLGR